MSRIHVHSEIGSLEGVILHPPGPEVENMTPKNAERALYSDILNLAVARKEYNQLECTLQQLTRTYRVQDLLRDVLKSHQVREKIIKKTCYNEGHPELVESLLEKEPHELARLLIQGIPLDRTNLTNFMSKENYALKPLHNFFFTRDAAVALYDRILIGKMANKVRDREALIMESIFDYHPQLRAQTVVPEDPSGRSEQVTLEGGDILVAREDIILTGIGSRTSTQGVDFLINLLKERKTSQHLIVQELPQTPESFIHLDMVFTFLDRDACMVYAPLILQPNKYETVHIQIDNGKVSSIRTVENIPHILTGLGMDLKPSFCGGNSDSISMEREQWHSGANFFAVGPGKVIGYNRNIHTLENLHRNGFEIIKSRDFLDGKYKLEEYDRYVLTIDGSELSRGGGGARCMTMPFRRKSLT